MCKDIVGDRPLMRGDVMDIRQSSFPVAAFVAFCVAAMAVAVLPVPASATTDGLQAFFGNTLISVDGGIESHFYYKPDHTFTGKIPAFYMVMKGTWSEKPDGTVCRVFDPPLPTMKNPDCGPMRVHKLGDHETDANGDSENLVPGIR